MKQIYTDKHGTAIIPGAIIRHDSGRIEKIFSVHGVPEDETLGIVAVNQHYMDTIYPDWQVQFYGLSNYNPREWEIISKKEESVCRK